MNSRLSFSFVSLLVNNNGNCSCYRIFAHETHTKFNKFPYVAVIIIIIIIIIIITSVISFIILLLLFLLLLLFFFYYFFYSCYISFTIIIIVTLFLFIIIIIIIIMIYLLFYNYTYISQMVRNNYRCCCYCSVKQKLETNESGLQYGKMCCFFLLIKPC